MYNSQFTILIRGISFQREVELQDLINASDELVDEFKENKITNNQPLVNFCKAELEDIYNEYKRIFKYAQICSSKIYNTEYDIESLDQLETKQNYFSDVGVIMGDIISEMLKFLIYFAPEYFNSESRTKLLNEWLPYDREAKKIISDLPPLQKTPENETIRYTAKHYVLAYLIECNAKGVSFPIGQKKELEKIGNQRIGEGKGNRFYKVFNEIVNKNLNTESNLIEIGGKNWRTIVKDLSNESESIETYLQGKQL